MMLSTVAGEQLGRRAPSRLLLEIDVGECLPVVISGDESGVFFDKSKAAGSGARLAWSEDSTPRRRVRAVIAVGRPVVRPPPLPV